MKEKDPIEIDQVYSTEDCVKALNKHIMQSDWKRKTKFDIKSDIKITVRVFSNGEYAVSVIDHEDEGCWIFPINLSHVKPLLHEIQAVARRFYTHDYGQVFLNPFTMTIVFSGGDGGFCYSEEKPAAVIAKLNEDGFDYEHETPTRTFEEFIPQIKGTEFEAEYFPEVSEGWLQVAKGIDIGNYGY